MKKSIFLAMLALLSICVFAKGKIEYTVTEKLLIDDREKDPLSNVFGGSYWPHSNTINNKTGNTLSELDINAAPGYNGSKHCLHLKSSLDLKSKDPYAGFGMNLKRGKVMDASEYFGICFYAKGTGKVWFELVDPGYKARNAYNNYRCIIELKPDWTYYEIPFSDLKLANYGPMYEFKPSEIEHINVAYNMDLKSANVDLYMDDLAFFKAKIKGVQADTVVAEIKEDTSQKIEYTVTDKLIVDDREKYFNNNFFGGGYWTNSNTLRDKKGKTLLDIDYNAMPGYNGSEHCLHLKFSLDTSIESPWANFGTNLKSNQTVMDLSKYYGLCFYAKGSGYVYIRLGTAASKKEGNGYQYPIELTPDWNLYEIPFSDLKPPPWGPEYVFKPSEIFEIKVDSVDKLFPNVDLYMDDIAFFKATIRETKHKVEVADADKSGKVETTGAVKETGRKKLSQKKLDDVMGKRIAVVGLGSQNLNSKVTNIVIDFIVDAFVNSGSVKVIDRSSIEKILKEQEFQMQDFVDNTKVMAIGKLLGAEYVVTGSLNKIDENMYLNIKLISVATAEIMGSSVTRAPEKSDYMDLCNNAVLKLFM